MLEFQGIKKSTDQFRINAYYRAALIIRDLPQAIETIAHEGKLREITGIGEAIAGKIEEYIKTGKVQWYDELRKNIPPGLLGLMNIPGIGPKKLRRLYEELGVHDEKSLQDAINSGAMAGLKGMGEKSAQNLAAGLARSIKVAQRMLLGKIYHFAQNMRTAMNMCPQVYDVVLAGSFRRSEETIGDIDLLATGKTAADRAAIVDYFVHLPNVTEILAHGDTKASVYTKEGRQVDLRVIPMNEWGAALQYFTGSKEHNVHVRTIAKQKGLKINEYGVFKGRRKIAGDTEESVYKVLGMQWIPPEMRVDKGEIEAALAGKIPAVVKLSDLRGDLHVHADWSDGLNTIEEMVQKAVGLGYEYVAITDHSPSLKVAKGLTHERVIAKKKEITLLQKRYNIRIYMGTECDILADGSLDYPEKTLQLFDVVVASVHSLFKQDNTERILKAMENKYVDIIGHPTGRLISRRDPYGIDLTAVGKKAVKTGIALEINSHYERMDLHGDAVREAAKLGAHFAINTDAHEKNSLWMMVLGVGIARRGWLTKEQVVNAQGLRWFEQWRIARRKGCKTACK